MKITHPIIVCGLLSGAAHAAALALTPSSQPHRIELGQAATSLQVSLTTSSAARPTTTKSADNKLARLTPVLPSHRQDRKKKQKPPAEASESTPLLVSRSAVSHVATVKQTKAVTAEHRPTSARATPPQSNAHMTSASSAASLAQRRNLISERLQHELATFFRYPYAARRRGWQGRVVLNVSIMPNGHVQRVALHRSSGHAVLDDAALATMHRITQLDWAPALLRGEAVKIELPVIYQLMGG